MMNAKFTKIASIMAAILVGASSFGIATYAGTKWLGGRGSKTEQTEQTEQTEKTEKIEQTAEHHITGNETDNTGNENDNTPADNNTADNDANSIIEKWFGNFGNGGSDNNGFGGFGNDRSGMNGFGGGFGGPGESNVTISENPSEIVTGAVTSSAQSLEPDLKNAATIVMSESNNEVKISEAGTYIVTGTCSDGNITVKKETTGVVLILEDLDLTSKTGAALSLNKGSEVRLVIEGTVKLTDAEDPADENSSDAETADAFDGAAIKVKDGANVYITGSGELVIDASACKNGIKSGDEEGTVLVIDGPDVIVKAANDAFNAGRDLTILNGKITISAGDDAIHADRILTIGSENAAGPEISITTCKEGLEGTIVNICSGSVDINSSDDAINAANSDKTYASELRFAVNIIGGTVNINSRGDGIDSNQDINLIGGTITIKSASNGGEAGIDYDGDYYISDEVVLNNSSGVSGPDMMGGFGGFGGEGGRGNSPWGTNDNENSGSEGNSNFGNFPWGTNGNENGGTEENSGFGGFPGRNRDDRQGSSRNNTNEAVQ